MHIAIIGAGMTGLTAAFRLMQQGHTVTLLEHSQQVGGLAAGFPLEGTHLEMAYHHIFATDIDIIELAHEVGVGDALVWCDSSVGLYFDGRHYSFTGALDLLRFAPLTLLQRIRFGVVALYLQKTKHGEKFSDVTAHEWMSRACGKVAYQTVWEPLLKGKFHDAYKSVSMAWLWARLHIRASSRGGEHGEKLGYFRGGFYVLIHALEQKLQEGGVQIQLGTSVHRLHKTSEGVAVETAGGKQMFDRVICTIPSSIFAKLIQEQEVDPTYITSLQSIQYLGAVCVVFTSPQSLSEYYWTNVNDPESPFIACIQHTKLVDPSWYGGKHVYYLGAYLPHDHPFFSMEKDDLTQTFFAYFKKFYPDFDASAVKEKHVFRFRNAQHIVDCNFQKTIPSHQTPVEGVYLANFSQIFPEDRGTNMAVRQANRLVKEFF